VDKFLAILIKHAVCPMPQLRLRFKDPNTSFFFGDSRDRRVIGERLSSMMRSLITFYDPGAPTDTEADPLAKVRPLLDQLRTSCHKYWIPGAVLAGDEQTVYLRCRWKKKQRIKCKKHGDGVQVCELTAANTNHVWYGSNNVHFNLHCCPYR